MRQNCPQDAIGSQSDVSAGRILAKAFQYLWAKPEHIILEYRWFPYVLLISLAALGAPALPFLCSIGLALVSV